MTQHIGEREVLVTEVELEHGVSAGILWGGIAGLVPVQEEHEARLERNIGLEEWGRMDTMEKALIIAARRNRIAIANIQTEAEIRKAERDAKRR